MDKPSHNLSHETYRVDSALSQVSALPDNAGSYMRTLPKCYRWRPTFWRVRPLLGMLAFMIAIICLFASLTILQVSNGDPISNWLFQPQVYLAIATALSNTAIQCSLALAAPISWWYKALQGSCVKDLELDWEAGQSFPRALMKSIKYRRGLSLYLIASLSAAIVLIDGPLLQRASSVKQITAVDELSLNISIATQLPAGFSVHVDDHGGWAYTPAAVTVFEQFLNNKPIISGTHCNGTCRTKIRAPGYTKVGCKRQSWAINETMLRDPNSTWGIGTRVGANGMALQPLVYSTAFPIWGYCDLEHGREPLIVSTGTANYDKCQGQFTFANCTLMPAVIEFDIEIQGNTITYMPPNMSRRAIAVPSNYCHSQLVGDFATMAFGSMMQSYVTANGSLGRWLSPGPGRYPLEAYNTLTFNSFSMKYLKITPGKEACTMIAHDPMNDIVAAFNDLLFRSGVYIGTNSINSSVPVHQTVRADRSQEQDVYHSDFGWFAAAAAVQILTMLLILPAYWGWWRIGVELTVSPFHTAKAFDAPIFSPVNSAAGSTGVVDETGEMRLKLGAVDVFVPGYQTTKDSVQQLVTPGSRVGIAESNWVTGPVKGARFTY